MKPLDMSVNMVSPYLAFACMSMRKQSPCLFTIKFCYTPCRIACSEVQLEFEELQLLVLTRQWKRALRDRSSSEKQWMNDIDMLVTTGVRSQKQHRTTQNNIEFSHTFLIVAEHFSTKSISLVFKLWPSIVKFVSFSENIQTKRSKQREIVDIINRFLVFSRRNQGKTVHLRQHSRAFV